jgi:uncharacterized protein (TIGR00661 family)
LRPEVAGLTWEPAEHVLVYQTQTTNVDLVPSLKRLPYRFKVYGLGREGVEGNVTLCSFSETRFLEDLRTARGVIAGGGFTLLSEAVSIGIPVLSVPVRAQYEQELNARYIEALGYGSWAKQLDTDVVARFLDRIPEFVRALESRPRADNQVLFGCLDELIGCIARGEKRPKRLNSPAPGKWEPSP